MTAPNLFVNRTVVSPTLVVPTGLPYTYQIVARLAIDLNVGDYVSIFGAIEGTNDLGFNVMLARYMKESANATEPSSAEGTLINRAMAENITPDMHHCLQTVGGHFVATATRTHNFMIVSYAASSAAHAGDTISMSYVELLAAVTHAV